MPDPPAHSANHYHSYDSQPKSPASPPPSFYYGHHPRHHHGHHNSGPMHTHYFTPQPQVPPYQDFSFPAIFNDVPDDIPQIGKNIYGNNSGRRIRTVNPNDSSISSSSQSSNPICSPPGVPVPSYEIQPEDNVAGDVLLNPTFDPKLNKVKEQLKKNVLECIRPAYLTPRLYDCKIAQNEFINL